MDRLDNILQERQRRIEIIIQGYICGYKGMD